MGSSRTPEEAGRRGGEGVTDAAETGERDLLYQEYVRLAEAGNALVRDALSDVKLLGGVAAVLAWEPLAGYLELDARLELPVTPIGFTTLLLVVMFLLFYNLLKQSIFFTRALRRS